MAKRRVVITGLGAISPLGLDVKTTWEQILAGKSGIASIEAFDVSNFPVRFAGLIKDFDVSNYLSAKEARKMDPFIHYGIAAAAEAIKDAGLEITEENAHRIGVSIGSGIGGLGSIEKAANALTKGGPRKITPFFVPSSIINMVSGNLSILYGITGPNITLATACTTGTHSIGEAARIIAYGDADVMLAGGAEAAATPLGLGGFGAARALSTRNDDPTTASRPWDLNRDGFVLSDGAGVLVLEEYEHARKRGVEIYAEIAGYGRSADAHHMTQPIESGAGAQRCMENALNDCGLNVTDIDYINAHGTSTPAGDKAETQAIKAAFGEYAYKVPVSSTKSMTGHLLGAAGGIEAIFCALALRDQVAPPTINLTTPDPDCDLDYIPDEARPIKINSVLSNSFGFGGTNGTLVLTKL